MSVNSGVQATRYSFKAGDNVKTSTSQYKVASISASMTVVVPTSVNDPIIGIIESMQSETSESVTLITAGIAKGVMRTGTSCAIGTYLVFDLLGTLDIAVTDTTSQTLVGRALNVPKTGGAVAVMFNCMRKTTEINTV